VYDTKVVRRRRATLAVFVALSIALLTAYFGESGGGFFHALQRGAQEAFAPIETGASRALKPVRDLFGWTGDTFDAKKENKELKREVQRLRAALADAQTSQRDAEQLKGLVGLRDDTTFPRGTDPVTARVIARSPTVWYSSITIDKGSSDGVRLDQPVIGAASDPEDAGPTGALVGKVTSVSGGTARVTLITDPSIGVGAQVMPSGATGVVRPNVGNQRDLLMDFVEGGRVTENTTVATSGFTIAKDESLFPRGIPIGRVKEADLDELEVYRRVHIEPYADLKSIDIVQVLTKRGASSQNAGVVVP
jgi:rod shape-determining protein MreC